MKIVSDNNLRDLIEKYLYDDQSPENISGRLEKHEKHLPRISKNSIYRYIKSVYGRRVEHHRDQRRKQGRRKNKAGGLILKDRVFIDKRPKYINNRRRVGDTEGDFIVSGRTGKGVLLVVVGRRFRNPYLEQIIQPSLKTVTKSFQRIKRRFSEFTSMTTDNDLLFQHHKELERILDIKIYFCRPGHAWEKGTVENINKIIRKDILKSSNISKYSKIFIKRLEQKLNRRIMKCLNYKTPQELLDIYRKRKKR